jgi:hypothetical protein
MKMLEQKLELMSPAANIRLDGELHVITTPLPLKDLKPPHQNASFDLQNLS